jgi:hypothetical protein
MVCGVDRDESLEAVLHPNDEAEPVIGAIDCAVDFERLAVKWVSRINYRDVFRRGNVFPDGGSYVGLFCQCR